jgi:hypothetical protein
LGYFPLPRSLPPTVLASVHRPLCLRQVLQKAPKVSTEVKWSSGRERDGSQLERRKAVQTVSISMDGHEINVVAYKEAPH